MKPHGISIGLSRVKNTFFIHIRAFGTLQHDDYEFMVPTIESALIEVKEPKLNVLIDITELDGWTVNAAWDDFKFGMKHRREFEKIAVICSQRWQKGVMQVSNWFMPGEIKSFDNHHDALVWLESQ